MENTKANAGKQKSTDQFGVFKSKPAGIGFWARHPKLGRAVVSIGIACAIVAAAVVAVAIAALLISWANTSFGTIGLICSGAAVAVIVLSCVVFYVLGD